jgi:hypothetical protein
VVRMEDGGGDELPFEPEEEIHVVEAWGLRG